jgi:hypothetical protein
MKGEAEGAAFFDKKFTECFVIGIGPGAMNGFMRLK